MSKFDIKTDLTWRDIALRVALVLCTVAVIVWFMPRDNKPNFKMEVDKVWLYSDLTATFDFPVYKSDSVVKHEREQVMRDFEPYYIYSASVAEQQRTALSHFIWQKHPELGSDFLRLVLTPFDMLYEKGIVDTKKPLELETDTMKNLRRIDDREVSVINISQVYTPREAYEELLNTPSLQIYHTLLAQLDLNEFLLPNLTYDEDRSEAARLELLNSIPLASGVVQSGQKIVNQGEVVTPEILQVIESYQKELERRDQSNSTFASMIIGEALFVLIIISMFTIYLTLYRKDFFEHTRHIAMMYTLVILATVLASLMVDHSLLHVYILPFAIVPIFIRVFMDSRTAVMAHAAVVLICASILQRPLEFIAVQLAAGLTAVFSLRELSSRSQLFWTAIVTTMMAMLTNLSIFLIRHNDFSSIDGGEYVFLAISGIVLFCSYPMLYLIEKFFGFISDITLIELSDMNKVLLRRMSEVAPGTFQHSIQVGNLAAEIARKIGGNPQLVRTGALYHDIGKMNNPACFIENETLIPGGKGYHSGLTPVESAAQIIRHVSDGMEIANRIGLPKVITDFINTHHGTSCTAYFWNMYLRDGGDPSQIKAFTYPGRKPRTEEQVLLMLCDSIEAASRTLTDYSAASVDAFVEKMVAGKISEGQLEEADLSIKDLVTVKNVLKQYLVQVHHERVEYPENKTNK